MSGGRATVLAAMLACAGAHAQQPTPRHDPFARPAFLEPRQPPLVSSDARRSTRIAPVEPKHTLSLNAVLVAGPASLANVNGTMVRVGEFVQGYELLEVHERSAVLQKNKVRFTLELQANKKPTQAGEARIVPAASGGNGK